jgi:hypothetical protein
VRSRYQWFANRTASVSDQPSSVPPYVHVRSTSSYARSGYLENPNAYPPATQHS